MKARNKDYDVVIIGAGPGGSTVGSIVAKAGHRVLVLDKAVFPRYQIGESLLLATWDIFSILGVKERIAKAGFKRKPGATFLWGNESRPWSVYFAELNGRQADSRNVKRSEFDQILIDRTIELGAEVRFDASVNEIVLEDGRAVGVDAVVGGEPRRISARYVIDASGRGSRLSKGLANRYCPDDFRGAAIWTYFKGVKQLPAPNEGNILYAMFTWGWFWVIPLADGITSVGVVMNPPKFKETVARAGGREDLYWAAIAACPMVAGMLEGAERADVFRSCSDYSQDSDRYHGPGFLLVGDTACFIDPILSTGVHLAMRGGFLAGLALNTVLKTGSEEAIATFEDLYRREYNRLLLVSRQQYELNKDSGDRFWEAHCILSSNLKDKSFQEDRLAFIHLIAGMGDDREAILKAQIESKRATFMKYGLGRFDRDEFLDERVVVATGELRVETGYKVGSRRRLTFVRDKLVRNAEGTTHALNAADIELLRLCDGRRRVRDVVAAYRERFGLSPDRDAELQRSLGYWVSQGVLRGESQASSAASAAPLAQLSL